MFDKFDVVGEEFYVEEVGVVFWVLYWGGVDVGVGDVYVVVGEGVVEDGYDGDVVFGEDWEDVFGYGFGDVGDGDLGGEE